MPKKTKNPADYVFIEGGIIHGTYLFEDGSVGYIANPEFDPTDYYEDEDWEDYDPMETDEVPPHLYQDGKKPIGNIYIDRYIAFGDNGFQQGGCFWYYEGETLRDYCERNGEPLPVKELPDEVYDALENDDLNAFRKYVRVYPELKSFLDDVPEPKTKKKQNRGSDVPVLNPRFVPIKPLSEDDYWYNDLKICPNCGSDLFQWMGDTDVKICSECGCAYSTSRAEVYQEYWDHQKFDEYRMEKEKERQNWFKNGANYAVFGGEAYSPENFDRLRYGALFDYKKPKDRSRILNFNFRRKQR